MNAPPSNCAPQILVCGSELFTGNTALCFAALLEGKPLPAKGEAKPADAPK